jgi:hypothetical protein
MVDGIIKEDQVFVATRNAPPGKFKHRLKVKKWKKIFQVNAAPKQQKYLYPHLTKQTSYKN